MTNGREVQSTTANRDTIFGKILNVKRGSLNELGSTDHEEDTEYDDDNEDGVEFGMLSTDNKSDWVTSTISTTVQHCIDGVPLKQMRHDDLRLLGWWVVANYFREKYVKYSSASNISVLEECLCHS
jgi:hypothetical protein